MGLWCAFLFFVPVVAGQDLTKQEGATGAQVVESVVGLIRGSCLFPNDKLFLRRAAFVETTDGTDPKTYRAGYNGGIWQVGLDRFKHIQSSSEAAALFPGLSQHFGIDWATVTWSDLRKPLYSGIAAALYLKTSVNSTIPRRIEEQAAFYSSHFRSYTDAAHIFNIKAEKFDHGCKRKNLDLAFLVDSSSSLRREDFVLAKEFAVRIVDAFTIGPNDVRVAFVTYATGYKAHFNFDTYTTKGQVKQGINQIVKVEGITDTDQALRFAATSLFTKSKGSRDGASKVILLITDGQSTDKNKTKEEARIARDKGITIFAIGVGSRTDAGELNNMASSPKCTHTVLLNAYADLNTLDLEIQQVSCRASAILSKGIYTYSCGQSQLFEVRSNGSYSLTTVYVTSGSAKIYGSFIDQSPNQAYNEFRMTSATTTNLYPAVIYTKHENRPMYLNVSACSSLHGCQGNFSVMISGLHVVAPSSHIMCDDGVSVRNCTVIDILKDLYNYLTPPYSFANRCPGLPDGFWEHPTLLNKFIYCYSGEPNVFSCPSNMIYDHNIQGCKNGVPQTHNPTAAQTSLPTVANTAPPTTPNPCDSGSNIRRQYVHYGGDSTKYIDCSLYPNPGYLKQCPLNYIWNQARLTCVDTSISGSTTLSNVLTGSTVCRFGLRDGDLFFFPYDQDRHRYIHCGQFGDAHLMSCPDNRVWQERLLTCVPDGLVSVG